MPRKIAPTLRRLASVHWEKWYGMAASDNASRELRALLAVARAAERMMRVRTPGGGGAWVEPGAERLASALARLSSPSTRRGKGAKTP